MKYIILFFVYFVISLFIGCKPADFQEEGGNNIVCLKVRQIEGLGTQTNFYKVTLDEYKRWAFSIGTNCVAFVDKSAVICGEFQISVVKMVYCED